MTRKVVKCEGVPEGYAPEGRVYIASMNAAFGCGSFWRDSDPIEAISKVDREFRNAFNAGKETLRGNLWLVPDVECDIGPDGVFPAERGDEELNLWWFEIDQHGEISEHVR